MFSLRKIITAVQQNLSILQARLYFSRLHGGDWSYSYHPLLGDRFTRQAEIGQIGLVACIMADPRSLLDQSLSDTYVMKVTIVYKGRILSTDYYSSGRVQFVNPTKVRTLNKAFDQVCNEALAAHRKIL